MVASFGGRLFAAVARLTPYYLPDEYIYPSLARSLAESGRPLIRGASVHFPALLEPIVTAPVWLVTNDPVTAFRLTQGIHAVLFSLAAVPAYLLCRRLGLAQWLGLAVAALAVAVPDGVYSSTMLADPLAYPLVLSAVYAGVCVVSEPTLRAQLAFAVISALGVFARIQYVIVPLAVVVAEVVVDRFHLVRAVRRLWLSLVLLIVPPVLLLATLGSARVFGVYANGDRAVHPGSILHWVGLEAMLLTYSTGWVIVPGALAGLGIALFRSRNRAELAFAVTTVILACGLLLEAAQIADTDSGRFQERYLFSLVPLLAIAFCLYVKRGLPGRIPVGLLSAGLLLLAARVPLSGYAAAHNKDDSPTLWAVLRFEGLTSVGNGSLSSPPCCRCSVHSLRSARCRPRSRSSRPLSPARPCQPAHPRSTPARAEACTARFRTTSAGSTTHGSVTSTSLLPQARSRSSRGSSSSGTPPSSGSSCLGVRRSISSTRRPSVSRAMENSSWTDGRADGLCSSRPTRRRSS
jgi:hypothetical protein